MALCVCVLPPEPRPSECSQICKCVYACPHRKCECVPGGISVTPGAQYRGAFVFLVLGNPWESACVLEPLLSMSGHGWFRERLGPGAEPPVSVRVGSAPLSVGGCSCACLWRVGGFLFVSVRDPVCFLCVYVTWRVPACQRLRVFPRVGWRLWVCPHVCHGDSRHMMAFRGCGKCGYLNGGGLEAETATAMLASLFCHYIVSKSEREDLSAFFPSPSEAPGPYQHGPRAPSPRPLGWPDLCSSAPPALAEATSTPPSDLRPSQPPQHHRSPHPPPTTSPVQPRQKQLLLR